MKNSKFRKHPVIILANTFNQFMLEKPLYDYSKYLSSVTPRKIWYAREGDIVITSIPIDNEFKNYAAAILKIDPDKVKNIVPGGDIQTHLADRLAESEYYDEIRGFVRKYPDTKFLCFATDKPTTNLLRAIQSGFIEYTSLPNEQVLRLIYDQNTKSGFRSTMKQLGLPIARGMSCHGILALRSAVKLLLRNTKKIIVKLNSGSNGYGHITLTNEEIKSRGIETILRDGLAKVSNQPLKFVIEEFHSFISLPSIILNVTDSGGEILFLCTIECNNNAWSGAVCTPALDLSDEITNNLNRIGTKYADYLYNSGFRGLCDLDCGLTDDDNIIISEANVRRDGATYPHDLVKRITCDDYLGKYIWMVNVKQLCKPLTFSECLTGLTDSRLAFDHARKEGVIITANTLKYDNKLRYLIISRDIGHARRMQEKMERIFPFDAN